MGKVKASYVAAKALAAAVGDIIPYALGGTTPEGMDCQGLVRWAVAQCGGDVGASGSNTIYRKCVEAPFALTGETWRRVEAGYALFIIRASGAEPKAYWGDGIGDVYHMGLAVKAGAICSVDASESAGRVRALTPTQARQMWTHAARLKAVEYDAPEQGSALYDTPETSAPERDAEASVEPPIDDTSASAEQGSVLQDAGQEPVPMEPPASAAPAQPAALVSQWYRVSTSGGGLRVRKTPSVVGEYMCTLNYGLVVEALGATGDGWIKIAFNKGGKRKYTGYAVAEYLTPCDSRGENILH
ncbi:MAG: SH3 domain-containing protein [Oscillospiraceae bacterium]|jgi:hypothetical protein|nr:SH3 domain-containing protein [Oscillospiraceae bacterium]